MVVITECRAPCVVAWAPLLGGSQQSGFAYTSVPINVMNCTDISTATSVADKGDISASILNFG